MISLVSGQEVHWLLIESDSTAIADRQAVHRSKNMVLHLGMKMLLIIDRPLAVGLMNS